MYNYRVTIRDKGTEGEEMEKDLKYKLILSDVDGTLINDKNQISEENVQAIQKAEGKGAIFAIVSGRQPKHIEDIVKEKEINPVIVGLNGASIKMSNGDVLAYNLLPKNQVIEIIEILDKSDYIYKLYNENSIIGRKPVNYIEHVENMVNQMIKPNEDRNELIEFFKEILFEDVEIIENPKEYIEKEEFEVLKIEVMHCKKDSLERLEDNIKELEDINVTSSFFSNIEITHTKGNKGQALIELAKYFNISREEVIAMGDNLNDLEMIREAGLGVAMENAVERLKNEANYITTSNINHGVAHVINTFINN